MTSVSEMSGVGRGGEPQPRINRELQRVAVEESRLGIPLIFAADVWHGMWTIFPAPLAEAMVVGSVDLMKENDTYYLCLGNVLL